ncbi:Glycine betaine/proline betaine-binding periplasmic protein [subsurface metagenome]
MVPTWVSEQYGITSVSDLKDPEIAKMFDDDGDGIGDIMGCDAAWKCAAVIDEQIAGYELADLYEQKYGAEAMMMAAVEGKMMKDEPVLLYLYTPHPFFVRYPAGESLVWLDDPKDFWPTAKVYAISSVDWIKNNPEATQLLNQVEFIPDDIGWIMTQVEEKGDSPEVLEAAAREWMAAHQSEVDAWIKAVK